MGGSSTAPPLDGSDTSVTPEQRKAYAEIGEALGGWRATLNAAATVYPPQQAATAQGLIDLARGYTMCERYGIGLGTMKEQKQ